MAKILDREAIIKTAQVEIKALTVSGKQVTQALLKQLEHKRLIDVVRLTYNGIPWGRINYHVECSQKPGRRHHHVVWQDGEELRRDCIWAYDFEEAADSLDADMNAALGAAALILSLSNEPEWGDRTVTASMAIWSPEVLRVTGEGQQVRMSSADRGVGTAALNYWLARKKGVSDEALRTALIEAFRRRWDIDPEWQDHTVLYWVQEFQRLKLERQRVPQRFGEIWNEIEALDQLFISV